VGGELVTFAERMREGLLAASVGIGLEVLGELMAAEVSELAGPRGKHDADRAAYRHGEQDGAVVLGGRTVAVRRPRVRSVDGAEVHLASYDSLTEVDLLTEHTVAAMLAGLSTRRYAAALEPAAPRCRPPRRRPATRPRRAGSSPRPHSVWPRCGPRTCPVNAG
jgi:putative transposase